MTERKTFLRKIAYAGAIVALLIPLSFLSQPQTQLSPGGQLAKLRSDYRLSQANLGDIDPASETMKLATLGLRPVAVVALWESAHDYKKREDFTNLAATLEQITKLQPNFIKVWDFQAHNLTYNVSAEFDDYHDRYTWVRKGLEFLIRGTEYNRDSPLLLSRVGFFVYHKIGKSDERVQFRQMFKEDAELQDYMNSRSGGWLDSKIIFNPQADRDSWLVAHKWYLLGEDVVDRKGKPSEGTSPVIYHSEPAMMLINYAMTLEAEGHFGEEARNAWRRAGVEFARFGERDFRGIDDIQFRLNDRERHEKRSDELLEQCAALLPAGAYDALNQEKRASLTDEDRQMLALSPTTLTIGQKAYLDILRRRLRPTAGELMARADDKNRAEVERLANEMIAAEKLAYTIDGYRSTVNYDYWKGRCEIEQTDPALETRESIYLAAREADKGNLLEAKRLYDKGWTNWRKVLDSAPRIREDDITGDDMMEEVNKYFSVLQGLDQDKGFPEGFALQHLVEYYDKSGRWRKDPASIFQQPTPQTQPQ
jgi:hypothetical protein